MLKIWGRANSVNVQKVLWTCDEIALPYERIDAGMKFGINTTPPFLANNPNGKIPLIEDGDFLLWESNAIMRYLALAHGGSAIYPADPKVRGGVERWLDWTISTLQPAERPVFWGYVRTAPAQRDNTELRLAAEKLGEVYGILDHHLAGRTFVEGEAFSLADIALACFARRWLNIAEIERPKVANIDRWYAGLQHRRAFEHYLLGPLS